MYGLDVFESDVNMAIPARLQIPLEDRSHAVLIVIIADHVGRAGTVADDVVLPDLFGAFRHVCKGRDRNAAQVRDLAEHVDLVCEILATAVCNQAKLLQDRQLMLQQEFVVHRRRHAGELLGSHVGPQSAPIHAVRVCRGIFQLLCVWHGLVLMGAQPPVAGGLGLVVGFEHSVRHELDQATKPIGIVRHVHHEVLDSSEIPQVGGQVAGPHSVCRPAINVDCDDVADGVGQPLNVFGRLRFVNLVPGRAELPDIVELLDGIVYLE